MTYREVLRVREFRAIFLSQGLSTVGDQVTRIAVALLVYDRSGSAFAASATYACSFFTWLVGGPFLSVVADRYPRLNVMVASDIARAVLVALLAIPDLHLGVIFLLLFLVGVLAPPFDASRSALLPEVLDGERYLVGNVLMNAIFQGGQVAGFLLGGTLVAAVGYEAALLLDSGSFLVSAGALLMYVRSRPATQHSEDRKSFLRDTWEGVAAVVQTPELRWLLSFALLATAIVIPSEGLAVALADELGEGPFVAGALTAAVPAGFLLGSVLVVRIAAEHRLRTLPLLVLMAAIPLLAAPLITTAGLLIGLLVVSGLGSAVQLVVSAEYVRRTPAHLRGRAYGVAGTALMAVQGSALLVAGAAAELVSPRTVLAITGGIGLVLLPAVVRLAPAPMLAQGKT